MAFAASIEQINKELDTIKRRKQSMERMSAYINELEKRNLFMIKLCNMVLILVYFLFLAVQVWPMACTPQVQSIIIEFASIGKWPIAVVILFLYIYSNIMKEGVKT